MNNKEQVPTNWREWRTFIHKNWDIICEIYEKGLQKYFDSIDLLNIECLRCSKYEDESCSGWNWKEDPNTHKCIYFTENRE